MKSLLIIPLLLVSQLVAGQKIVSNKSTTTFFSGALLEDITATSKTGKCAIDGSTGEIACAITITSFKFDKSLMQEHFNEKYMESDKFPKATFKGKIENWLMGKSNDHVRASGMLTIHGVKREVEAPGSLIFDDGKLYLHSKFKVAVKDYDIEVPSLMFQKIAEVVEITLDYEFPIK